MADRQSRTLPTLALAPSVILLFVWMIVPLVLTLYFAFQRYNLNYPERSGFVWFRNFYFFLTDPAFLQALMNTLLLVGGVLAITVVGGILLALLLDQPVWGKGVVRLLLISPFFIMPTVSALVWKNMLMHTQYGMFAWLAQLLGQRPIAWLTDYPLQSVIMIVAWEWLPFATLILLTSMQSLDGEQLEAAEMDGASYPSRLRYIVLPHLARAISIVVLIECIFLLAIFAEIFVTTQGGPGFSSTNLPYLVFVQALVNFDVGAASAGGLVAVVLANVAAAFLLRIVGKNLVT